MLKVHSNEDKGIVNFCGSCLLKIIVQIFFRAWIGWLFFDNSNERKRGISLILRFCVRLAAKAREGQFMVKSERSKFTVRSQTE